MKALRLLGIVLSLNALLIQKANAQEIDYLLSNENNAAVFLAEAQAESKIGAQFIADTREWIEYRQQRGLELTGAIILDRKVRSRDLSFLGYGVVGFIGSQEYGVAQYRMGATFSPSLLDSYCMNSQGVSLAKICGVLSSLYSMVKLDILSADEIIDSDGFFKRSALVKAKKASGNPSRCGTTNEEIINIHENLSEGKVKCDQDATSLTGNGAKAACQKLLEALSENEDCTVMIRHPDGSHAVQARGGYSSGETCGVYSVDTSDHGSDGEGVPAVNEEQTWEITQGRMANQRLTPITYEKGPFPGFWGDYTSGARGADFICCRKQ